MERKRDRQPISVPFIWEEKPGMPKKDWKPTVQPVKPIVPPVKLVVSVPFEWEEKPGIPIPSFAQSPEDSIISSSPPRYLDQGNDSGQEGMSHSNLDTCSFTKPVKLVASVPFEWEEKPGIPIPSFVQSPKDSIIASSPSQYPGQDDDYGKEGFSDSNLGTCNSTNPVMPPAKLVASVPFEWEEKPGTPIPGFIQRSTVSTFAPPHENRFIFSSPPRYSGLGDDERDELSDSELDVWSCASDESYSSAPSLLANGLVSTSALSSAIPLQETCPALTTNNSEQLEIPGSPASETESTSSYATGTASLVGSSFLEWLFPLLMPNSSREVGCIEKNPSQTEDAQVKNFMKENSCNQVRRPLLTLEELIVMSRRRSCQRKVANMQKQPSMDFIKGNAFGCCIFRGGDSIVGLHKKWKRQLQLKLI
ncbi:hypothetical protein BUALT_Bualt06G0123500 [Buddleja alternifolia]|uniref:Hydroxyproline-rich glycoprotein family protein n=1 Tax=Buddleja alternifolia TaxID=168488 RepID=A0AAV6XG88_9LAMI|nr:hypothetical protein BUALT_Bualt06G0123500 [Buddleja alternifolia]